MIAYICDDELRERLNRRQQNYWDVYFEEITSQLGLTSRKIRLNEIEAALSDQSIRALFIGSQSGGLLTPGLRSAVEQWVRQGGILLGFGITGLDSVFGIETVGTIPQAENQYDLNGFFMPLPDSPIGAIHSPLAPHQKLLICSPVQLAKCAAGAPWAFYFKNNELPAEYTAVAWNHYHQGYAGYFCFDAARTVWLLHQGSPQAVAPAGQAYLRTCNLQIIGEQSNQVLYADEIIMILQAMLSCLPLPFIAPLPPQADKIPDALFFWGGDCCGAPSSNEIAAASDWMQSRGLPWHANVLFSKNAFNLTPEDAAHIVKNGHEISVHYNFPQPADKKQSEADLKRQNALFQEWYGRAPISSVIHCCAWHGWTDTAEWMAGCHTVADNSFIGKNVHLAAPDANAPFMGFGFGTAFPFAFFGDFTKRNARLPLLEEPITGYELGHRGSIRDRDSFHPGELHAAIDLALHYHLTFNCFYHAIYIASFPRCREAIDEILHYIARQKATVLHMGTDALANWWKIRRRSTVQITELGRNKVCFDTACEYPAGMIVKIAFAAAAQPVIMEDNQPLQGRCAAKSEFGRSWLYVMIKSGAHKYMLST
ncbi:MAG: hypothetical protein PHW60_16235 [Kiritimatiellae bacterium]|nr:hypothetical protein [Kiritimatiellia bacterium]